ncbi:MAG: transposase domain-containing protein [Acidobacteriaceae bacterium]|nr:transposase domain-containing protein [Acidobacteriaceae bacterium]
MARRIASLPAGRRITDAIRLDLMARFFRAERVHEILKTTNRASILGRDFPAPVVVYFVIAFALSMRSSYIEVMRCLLEGMQWFLAPSVNGKVAGQPGSSQARSRLGAQPLALLHETVVAPRAQRETQSAWYRQCRVFSLEGSTLDAAATAENDNALGRLGASCGASAFPKMRFVAWLARNNFTCRGPPAEKGKASRNGSWPKQSFQRLALGGPSADTLLGRPLLPESETLEDQELLHSAS